MSGSQSSEQVKAPADAKALAKQAEDCKKCEDYRSWLLSYSPSVRFMVQQIDRIGGNINASNIICGPCDEQKSGGFHPELGILLCQDKLASRSHCEDTLTHELVHAYDHCRFEVDWNNLRHHACSEIRASSLSGECRMMKQFLRAGNFKFGKGHQECVRRRAALSVAANPNCPDEATAKLLVNQVFDQCFNDTRPFDQIFR